MTNVGIVGIGTYLPKNIMTAKEISDATGGVWSEDAVRAKLGINQKYVPSADPCDGTQEMGALAALKCLENCGVDPLEIDVILCITEEWKEYPLTTSACYVQDRIGAKNAWGIDVQNRCCTCVSAMKLAKDILIATMRLTPFSYVAVTETVTSLITPTAAYPLCSTLAQAAARSFSRRITARTFSSVLTLCPTALLFTPAVLR